MGKIILYVGIEALNLFLCIHLAYVLLKEEQFTLKQRGIRFFACVVMVILNTVNLPLLYYNNLIWIQTDLFLIVFFKCSKGRHGFVRTGIAILIKHLLIYMDYAIGFLLVDSGNIRYSMEIVLYGRRIEIICAFFIARLVLFIAVIIWKPRIKEIFSDQRQTRRGVLVVDMISYLGVLIFQQLFMREINQIYVNRFYVTLAMGTVLCIIFYFYDSMVSQKERERLINTTNKMMEKNYRKLYKEQKRLEHTAHDFKNHINLLTQYLEEEKYKEAISYCRKLASPLEVVVQRSWSGNKILDTILNTKLSEAEEKNIRVHMDIDDMSKLPLADYDLCVILSNLFDNSIEACEYVEREKKEIFVSIKSTGVMFVIKFLNSMEKKPIKRNHKYHTIKRDEKSHGIGLESVQVSVEKYQGTLLLEHTEDQFTAVVSIAELPDKPEL